MINKYYVSERYLLDRESGILHDLKCPDNEASRDCGLDTINRPLLFDSKKVPQQGESIKVKTPGGKQKVTITGLCPHCFSLK